MRAIVIARPGGPEVLSLEERPLPKLAPGQVLIAVKAFGLNHAEAYFRSGAWGEVAEITGIECAGIVREDASGRFAAGQKVVAVVGGLGRSLNGSYAEFVAVPASNVAAVQTTLSWEELAALPESYATAWTALIGILKMARDRTIVIRGATSTVGQAAINIAAEAGAYVIATTRQRDRFEGLRALGAHETLIESPDLAGSIRQRRPAGVDAVLDIVGNTTILDSLAMLGRGGAACLVGFLGGLGPLESLQPVFQIPSGRFLTVFASAVVTGSGEFPLSEIPFQTIVDRAAAGTYNAKPARVFAFEEIREAHRLMELGGVGGKMVVRV